MDEPYDLLGGVLSSKANERMIGFAGFTRTGDTHPSPLEGIVKLAAFLREDGSGYLTLTFVIDRLPGETGSEPLSLGKPDPDALQNLLGPDFEMLIDIPLSPFTAGSPFYVEEMDLYFSRLRGREKAVIETGIFPAFSRLLGLRFEALQDWGLAGQPAAAGKVQSEPEAPAADTRSLFQRWFGGDA